jgi:hypothetical protein
MILTFDIIESGMSDYGGWNKKQLACIGVSWPPPSGWKWSVIGKNIKKRKIEAFLRFRKTKEEIDRDRLSFEDRIESAIEAEFLKQNENYYRNAT